MLNKRVLIYHMNVWWNPSPLGFKWHWRLSLWEKKTGKKHAYDCGDSFEVAGLKCWSHRQASGFVTFACPRWYAPNTFPPFATIIVAPFNCLKSTQCFHVFLLLSLRCLRTDNLHRRLFVSQFSTIVIIVYFGSLSLIPVQQIGKYLCVWFSPQVTLSFIFYEFFSFAFPSGPSCSKGR